ncbi:MAG TPA: hypothetical protein VGV60_07390 [Candidatus Polarisedimenticolia bacterium]|nr:hypothetical protein [Candidatus Polarisedimenticolia bacterium]
MANRKGSRLDALADDYVRLVLAVERHDRHFIDCYFGPPAWRVEARRGKPRPLPRLLSQAGTLRDAVRAEPVSERREFLERQIVAVESGLRRLSGERLAWPELLSTQLDAEPVPFRASEIRVLHDRLETILPGRGRIADRMGRFYRRCAVRPSRLWGVALDCLRLLRARTDACFALPPNEGVRLRLVRGKPWGAYSRYLGGGRSLVELNADRPQHPAGLLATMAHEAYPGHHTFLALREQVLVRENGWREHAVLVLASPLSVVAEGAACMALRVIMAEPDIREFLRRIFATETGASGRDVETYLAVDSAIGLGRDEVTLAMEAGRRALEEGATSREIIRFMTRGGVSPANARSLVPFIRTYGAYICSYRLGMDLMERYLGDGPDRIRRYGEVLRRPFTPAALRRAAKRPEPRSGSS